MFSQLAWHRALVLLLLSSLLAVAGEKVPPPPGSPRDVDTHHLFTPKRSWKEWEVRRDELRERILFGAGLWPMPERTPLNATVTGRFEAADFTVENVVLTTRNGFYLCGNLYRPKGKTGPFPAIANPHGHWEKGRWTQEADVPEAASLAEKPAAGRANLTAIGVGLARAGFICFAYDMPGYADTLQMKHRTFTKDDLGAWSWSVNLLGLQLWNSIRVVDYLESLPDVDKTKIGATGASGGGSQTFLLGAVDDRIAATVPVNMVSAHMQGGCLCENGPALRVGTDNAEIAAMMAPRPQLLISCTGDWTKNVPNEEFPQIRRVYELAGKPERIESVIFHFQHNYNQKSREAMLAFFCRTLKGQNIQPKEAPFELPEKTLRVWTDRHPQPTDGLNEQQLRDAMIAETNLRLERDLPKNKDEWKRFATDYSNALRISLALNAPSIGQPPPQTLSKHTVLIVTLEGDADAALESELSRELTTREISAVSLRLPGIQATEKSMLDKFFSCYNRTPVGDRVQLIADTVATLSESTGAKKISVVGLGRAGAIALLARGAGVDAVRTVADLKGFLGTDADFLPDLYAPGLRRAGDLRSAAVIAMKEPLLLMNCKYEGVSEAINKAGFVGKELLLSSDSESSKRLAEWLARN